MATITEDYISFEIARLLEEKGFNEECFALYNPDGVLIQSGIRLNNIQVGRVEGSYSAPTLQMAMKWLREVHGLFISIEPCFDYELKHVVYLAFIQNVTDIDIFKEGRVEVASGYTVEAVYGKALKYCLEHLIK